MSGLRININWMDAGRMGAEGYFEWLIYRLL